jgi:hypothetical protein
MDFKTQLLALVPELFRLDNENFVKEINGEQITSTDLFEYFRVRKIHSITQLSNSLFLFFRVTVLYSLPEFYHRQKLCLKYVYPGQLIRSILPDEEISIQIFLLSF